MTGQRRVRCLALPPASSDIRNKPNHMQLALLFGSRKRERRGVYFRLSAWGTLLVLDLLARGHDRG